jgi:hypothetical protein
VAPDFDVNERLIESRRRGIGAELAVPLHERVDMLCDLVCDAGFERPSKGKMISAIILGAPEDAGELDRLLRAYDRAVVRDAIVGTDTIEGTVVSLPKRVSGPRPRRGR